MTAAAVEVDRMLRDGRLDIDRIDTDTMIDGRTHERLGQRYQGLPVFGGELIRQMDGGRVLTVFGNWFNNIALATIDPAIDAQAAAALAERAAGPGATASNTTLGVLPKGDGFILAYENLVRSDWNIETIFINATSGAVESKYSRIRDQAAIMSGTGVLRDAKKVSALQSAGGVFQAVDQLRPASAFTYDFHGNVSRFSSFFQSGVVFASDRATTSGSSWTDGAVVDAHVYQGMVYDFYFKQFGRRGLDDRNHSIFGIVHPFLRADVSRLSPDIIGAFVNNAAYLGDGFMLYGDGDGVLFDYLAGALDVVGHELTHGVIEFTANFNCCDESGALHEAFADIMGTSIEFFFQKAGGPQKGPNFQMADDVCLIPLICVRSLQNPAAFGDPDHYSQRRFIGTTTDNGGVHFNSTIVSHAFYLAVNGGVNRTSGISVQGVGLANIGRIERIFYRALTFYLVPTSRFSDTRTATLQAATDLFGASSNERAQVLQAWTAVGVP